jgi:hypothetical protein
MKSIRFPKFLKMLKKDAAESFIYYKKKRMPDLGQNHLQDETKTVSHSSC